MKFRIKTPMQSTLINVTEDLDGMTWADAKDLLENNYDIDFDNMAIVLRTQTDNKDDKQMIPLSLDQTILQLNEDNVLFMSNSEKIKSGWMDVDPDDYPNSVAGLKLLTKDMKAMAIERQYHVFIEKLNEIDSSLDQIKPLKQDEDDLEDEMEEIFG